VRDPAWQEHQRAGSGLPGLVAAESVDVAVQDEERLVAALVDVRRRREARWYPVIDDAEPPPVSAAPTLLIVRVLRNQNACPSSAATTKLPLAVWLSGFTACSFRCGCLQLQPHDGPPCCHDRQQDGSHGTRGGRMAVLGGVRDLACFGAGGKVTAVLFG
jgi:hypothetical protein